MKNLTAKYLSLMMLASLLSGTAQASHEGYASGDNCCRNEYVCGCNPLYCGAWDLQVQGGVAPILWRNRGPVLGVNCEQDTPVVNLFNETPKFSKFHKVPWYIGGQVGYAMSDNTRVYVEFNYSQANGKDNVVIATDFLSTANVTFANKKYKLFDAYVGARYYWDRWCDRLSFFLGGKVGLTHHKKLNADITLAFPAQVVVALADSSVNNSNTVVSGGANIGLDYCICGNWSLVLTGEVVASCGPRGAGFLHIPTGSQVAAGNFSDINFGSVGSELRFPVTLALRYSF